MAVAGCEFGAFAGFAFRFLTETRTPTVAGDSQYSIDERFTLRAPGGRLAVLAQLSLRRKRLRVRSAVLHFVPAFGDASGLTGLCGAPQVRSAVGAR